MRDEIIEERIDRDFLGDPLPKDGPLMPGPVQDLRKAGDFILWPVPGAGAPPAPPN
jgi:hypothetical protein